MGPEPCSVGTVILHNPVTLENKRVNPDELAKTLGHRGENVDNREVQEGIIDISGSMDDYSFAKDDNEDEKIEIELNPEEVESEFRSFSNNECLSIYKRLYKQDPKGVLEEIAAGGMVMRYLVQNHANKITRLLLHPFQVIMLDVNTWPYNSNYLQWLPEALLLVIYKFLLEASDNDNVNQGPYQLPIPRNPIQITLKSLKGNTWNFMVDKTFTVLQIKRALDPLNTHPTVRLIFSGKALEDDKTLGYYKIGNGDTLLVIYSLAQQGAQTGDSDSVSDEVVEEEEELKIITENDYQEHSISVETNRSLEYLCLQIWELLGLKPNEHSLWQGFQDLMVGWYVHDCSFSVVFLVWYLYVFGNIVDYRCIVPICPLSKILLPLSLIILNNNAWNRAKLSLRLVPTLLLVLNSATCPERLVVVTVNR